VKNALISPLHHQTITLPPTLPLPHHHHHQATANQTKKIVYQEPEKCALLGNDERDNDSTSSSNDSDSDSDEDAFKENQSGAAISRVIRIHNHFKYNEDGKEALQEPPTLSHDTNRPLSPLKNSSSKARIIDDLKNNKSSIYALIGSGWEANLDQL